MNNNEYFELKSLYQFKKYKLKFSEEPCYCVPYKSILRFKTNECFLVLDKIKVKHKYYEDNSFFRIFINEQIFFIFETKINSFTFNKYFKKLA